MTEFVITRGKMGKQATVTSGYRQGYKEQRKQFNRQPITIRLQDDLLQKIETFRLTRELTRTEAIEWVLLAYFYQGENQNEKEVS